MAVTSTQDQIDRLEYFQAWFMNRFGGKTYQVPTQRMADEMVAWINDDSRTPDPIAGILGFSQGGVAALFMNTQSWTELDAFEDRSRNPRPITTLAAEFQGTPASGGILATQIARRVIRVGRGCENRGQPQLSPMVATLRLANVPRSAREDVWYKRTVHLPFAPFRRHCQWLASRRIFGKDDAIAQNSRAALYKGAHATGVVERRCHDRGMKYSFSGNRPGLNSGFCQNSFLGLVPGNICE